jgi:hypothetical protein
MGKRERRRRRVDPTRAGTALPDGASSSLDNGTRTEVLASLVERRQALTVAIDAEVDRLVDAGVGWPRIADALGVTRQAARQMWLRRRTADNVRCRPGSEIQLCQFPGSHEGVTTDDPAAEDGEDNPASHPDPDIQRNVVTRQLECPPSRYSLGGSATPGPPPPAAANRPLPPFSVLR